MKPLSCVFAVYRRASFQCWKINPAASLVLYRYVSLTCPRGNMRVKSAESKGRVHHMEQQPAPRDDSAPWLARWGIVLCCLVFVAPVAIAMIFGTGLTSLSGNLWIILPLAVCLGLHFVLHKVTGKSCHTSKPEAQENTGQRPKP